MKRLGRRGGDGQLVCCQVGVPWNSVVLGRFWKCHLEGLGFGRLERNPASDREWLPAGIVAEIYTLRFG